MTRLNCQTTSVVLFVFTAVLSVVLVGGVFAQDLPSGGWTGSQTIGAGMEGYAVALPNGVYEVTGSGVALFMDNQEFHYLYKELSGDGTITGRVVDNGTGSNTWAKGGGMIRDTLDPGSAHCTTVVTGGSGGGAMMEWRTPAVSAGGKEQWAQGAGAPPLWFRVERIRDDFSCFQSEDGNHWTQIGSTQTIPMTDPVLIGLCVCSHAAGELRTFTFDNVSFEGDVSGEIPPEAAQDPLPDHEAADVPRDIQLSWNPGVFAETHNVYFGTSWDDVNDASVDNPMGVLVSEGQAGTSFDPNGPLELGQMYYWRVDEVNAAPDHTIFKGWVWSFMIEPVGYPVAAVAATSNGVSDAGVGPENTVDGSGLNENDEHSTAATDMWLAAPSAEPLHIQYEFDRVYKLHEMRVWNYNVQFELMLGFGLKDVTVEYSADGTEWVVLGDVQLAQATAKSDYMANTTIALGGVAAKFVRLIVSSGYGPMGQFGLSEVRFMQIPAYAREPEPADGATEVRVDAVLAWRAGRDAAAHEVHLSTDEQAVVEGSALIDTVSTTELVPANLEFGNVYYWKINEVNEAEAVVSWEGDIWSLAIQAFAVIDDMENHDDEENRIFDTWLDGFVNETGATVGYFEVPFAEKTIVNSGRQSMPLEYDNTTAPFYSEAELDVGSLNLDTNGADSLRLFIAGQADNAPNPVYVAVEDTSGNVVGVTHPDADLTTGTNWTEWRIPYSDLAGVDLSRAAVLYIGVGDRDNPSAGGTGLIFVDDIGYGRPATVE